ncbi:MAG: triple tyrosine motif-containing protein [Deltaproteobacteria bacterium]|nr:triple tyrosine motif-containing protein [Deltaproteobacteria bacterium]
MYKVAICLFWTLFFAPAVQAFAYETLGTTVTTRPRPLGKPPLRTFTVNGRVWDFAQTRDGRLWSAGSLGLSAFEGKAWSVIEGDGAPRGEIRALALMPDGSLYAGGAQGLWRLPEPGWTFTKVGGPPLAVQALASIGNKLWVGTPQGLYVLADDQGPLQARLIDDTEGKNVTALAATGDGENVWVGTTQGIELLAGQTLANVWQGSAVHAITGSKGGTWYAGSEDHGLLVRQAGGAWTSGVGKDWAFDPTVLSVAVDGPNALWAGISSGLVQGKQGVFSRVLETKDLPEARVQALFVDESHNLWMGLDGNSVVQLRQDLPIAAYPHAEGELPFALTSTSDGSVWMTMGRGLQRWTDKQLSLIMPAKRPFWSLRSIAAASPARLWAADFNLAVLQLDVAAEGYELAALPGRGGRLEGATTTYAAPDGSLWLGYDNGDVAHVRGEQVDAYPADASGCNGRITRLLQYTPTQILVSTTETGACLLHLPTKHYERVGTPAEHAYSITTLARLSNGEVWLGSLQNGVGRLANKHITWVGYDQGLRTELVAAILEDRRHNIWLAARSGIIRIPAHQLSDTADGKRTGVEPLPLATADGLMSTDCFSGWADPAVVDTQGKLWILTLKGPLMIDHPEGWPAPVWHAPEIASLSINGRPLYARGGETLQASADQGNVEIHYRAVALSEGRRVQFRYKLDGFDKQWVEASDRAEAFYTNLAPGRYQFRLQASLRGFGAVKDMPPLVVKLIPPFHKTVPFYILCALGALALVALVMRARSQERRRQQTLLAAERRRISQDIHDSLEQTFVAMRFQMDAARLVLGANEPAQGPLERTMSLMNRAMKETRAAIWALRAEFPGKADLVSQIAIVAGEASQGQGLQVQVKATGEPFALPVEVQRHALQITREALSNAMKHAKAANVLVEISFTAASVMIRMTDDGQGFSLQPSVTLAGHYGLSGMKERAQQIRAQLDIQSTPGKGTTVALTIPRPHKPKQGLS